MQNNDVTVRRKSYAAAKEIKASAHYAYVVNGITLDGSKFETGGFVEEGTCLVKDNTTGKYEPYKDTASAFPTGKSDPVILDESIKFTVDDKGKNARFHVILISRTHLYVTDLVTFHKEHALLAVQKTGGSSLTTVCRVTVSNLCVERFHRWKFTTTKEGIKFVQGKKLIAVSCNCLSDRYVIQYDTDIFNTGNEYVRRVAVIVSVDIILYPALIVCQDSSTVSPPRCSSGYLVGFWYAKIYTQFNTGFIIDHSTVTQRLPTKPFYTGVNVRLKLCGLLKDLLYSHLTATFVTLVRHSSKFFLCQNIGLSHICNRTAYTSYRVTIC